MGRLVAYIASAAIIVVAACTPPRVKDAPEPRHDPTRLSHPQHASVDCKDCHRGDKRPGTQDHAPCDRCHAAAFQGPPGPVCAVCHSSVEPAPLSAPLKPYPVDDAWQAEPPHFSHALHLDSGRMEKRVGFHVSCADCHVRDQRLARPDHATCSRCHAPEARLDKAPPMTACGSCHDSSPRPRARSRLIRGDLHFDHPAHVRDARGQAIRCEQCHQQTAQAKSYEDHAPPRVESCVTCHDDPGRTPNDLRMRECQACHRTKSATITALAPRNHLPLTERPIDHTLAFRRDHVEAAEQQASRCASCHTQMSGNPKHACDECHQTMQPADHRITWREYDHGPEAVADRTRCARCHVIEFCTACHAQRPRSHGMIGSFASDHGALARVSVRTCLTCHVQSFCDTCHRSKRR